MSMYQAKRFGSNQRRMGFESGRRGGEACLISVEGGSIAFDKCEHREATGGTGSECSSDDFQNRGGFVVLKAAAVQNIPMTEFLSRARRLQRTSNSSRTALKSMLSVVLVY